MLSGISASFARSLKSPDMGLPTTFLKFFVFGLLNRPINRYAVAKCELKPGQRVLEVGSGVGLGMHYALRRVAPHTIRYFRFNPLGRLFGPQLFGRFGLIPLKVHTKLDNDGVVHGLDPSKEMISLAARRFRPFIKAHRVMLHNTGVPNMPLPSSTIDACFHVDTFYFWPSLAECLEELHRVLRPGGVLVTAFAPHHIRRFIRWGWMRHGRPDFLAYAIALETVGFSNVEWIKNDPLAPRGVQCIRARKPPLKLLT